MLATPLAWIVTMSSDESAISHVEIASAATCSWQIHCAREMPARCLATGKERIGAAAASPNHYKTLRDNKKQM